MASGDFGFESAAGAVLAGTLDVPDGEVLGWGVFSHGFALGKDSIAAARICRGLAAAGIGMLRFDNLGLGGSGGSFGDTSFSLKVEDTVGAAAALEGSGRPVSLLVGHSLGGAAVLAAAGRLPGLKAVATIGAPYEPAHAEHLFNADLDEIEREGSAEVRLGGRRLEIRRSFVEDLHRHDLTDCIRGLQRPLMVMHSPTDDLVGIENASAIFRAARHPRNFISLEDSDHLLTGRGEAARAARIIAAWADQYLSRS